MNFIEQFNVEHLKDLANKGELIKTGSRTFSWRLFLGIIPEDKNFTKWVECIRHERIVFYKKSEELRITNNKDLDPKVFNPLAVNTHNNPWNNMFKDKEMRDLITQDIERTSQEYEFFTQKKIKDILIGILFLWAKENQDTLYKQGMNELLAIVVFTFFAERIETRIDYDNLDAETIASDQNDLINFIFDSRHTFADIYTTFNAVLLYGIKNLY